CAREGWLGYW
nr:immunoglobulin heavy chain junction region [Mus musculus]MBK4185604.1 immunoglobulin heavy chain junction region [Mus musculus]